MILLKKILVTFKMQIAPKKISFGTDSVDSTD